MSPSISLSTMALKLLLHISASPWLESGASLPESISSRQASSIQRWEPARWRSMRRIGCLFSADKATLRRLKAYICTWLATPPRTPLDPISLLTVAMYCHNLIAEYRIMIPLRVEGVWVKPIVEYSVHGCIVQISPWCIVQNHSHGGVRSIIVQDPRIHRMINSVDGL